MQFAQAAPKKKFYLLFCEVRRILKIHHSGNSSVVKILKRTFRTTNLELTSTGQIGLQFEDEAYVDAGNKEIATLQTEYFSKPFQKPVFSHLENTEKNFEEGSSRGAFPDSCEKRLTASKQRRPMHPHRPSCVLSPCFRHFLTFALFSRASLPAMGALPERYFPAVYPLGNNEYSHPLSVSGPIS
jgi:hypothetical protein